MEHGNHQISRSRLESLLSDAVGKTLGEVDINNVFNKTKKNPKITGIAGDVIEQSVLGYEADSKQNPDLDVDGIPVELKVTGLRKPKRNAKSKDFEAKEPMSITAVQPDKISAQTFETSPFWHKVKNMLIVYYLYDSDKTVTAADYANFPILDYQFYQFANEELETLRHDWQKVHDFLTNINENSSNPQSEYHRLSHELRNELEFIDTAPKYPHPPRFRIKRNVVSMMYRKLRGEKLVILPNDVTNLEMLDKLCAQLTDKYSGRTTRELMKEFDIPFTESGKVPKNAHEKIVVSMLGAKGEKINNLELFVRTGLIAKTVTLLANGKPKEDTKFYQLDFSDFTQDKVNDDLEAAPREYSFSDSALYAYLNDQLFFFSIFQFTDSKQTAEDGTSVFKGFKRITIPEEDIENYAQKLWEHTRNRILEKTLRDVPSNRTKRTEGVSSAPNFMKSKENPMFIRGGSTDSSDKYKTECVNGIKMLPQFFWMKKDYIQKLLNL